MEARARAANNGVPPAVAQMDGNGKTVGCQVCPRGDLVPLERSYINSIHARHKAEIMALIPTSPNSFSDVRI